MDEFAELESFNSSFKPQEPGGFKPGIDQLQDGDYTFLIVDAELTRTQKTNDLILKQTLHVIAGPSAIGKEIERAYFFKSQQNVDILGGDLCRLGIDADQWDANKGRPFSQELKKALPRLRGIKFQGKKTTKKDGDKTFANLFINALVSGGNAPPVGSLPPTDESIPF